MGCFCPLFHATTSDAAKVMYRERLAIRLDHVRRQPQLATRGQGWVPRFISPTVGDSRQTYLGCRNVGHDGQKEDNMTNNILNLAQQARTNAQLLTVSQGSIRSLTREDALKARGDVVEAIRRLQVFEKDLAKKLDT
jgi:hypothetical protein